MPRTFGDKLRPIFHLTFAAAKTKAFMAFFTLRTFVLDASEVARANNEAGITKRCPVQLFRAQNELNQRVIKCAEGNSAGTLKNETVTQTPGSGLPTLSPGEIALCSVLG